MTLVTDLITAGIVDEQDAIELKKKLTEKTLSPEEYFRALYFFFEGKVLTRPETGGFMFVMDPLAGYKVKLDQDTSKYDRFLDILLDNSVIDKTVHNKLKDFKLPGNKYTYLGALYLANDLSTFYQHFTIDKQLEFAELLGGSDLNYRLSMLSYQQKPKLVNDIKAGKIESYFDFFKYCYCCKVVNLKTYRRDSKKMLEKLTKLLNDLCYDAFTINSISLLEEDFKGEPSYDNKKTTLFINTGVKTHTHDYTFSISKGRTAHKTHLVLENLLTFTNQLLADYNRTYRFTSFTSTLNKELFPDSRNKCAICRVDIENSQIFDFSNLQDKFLYNRPRLFINPLPLSYTHIAYAVYHFRECGLLAHLTDEQINNSMFTIHTKTYENVGDLLSIFPDTIAQTQQYIGPGKKPYSDFLNALNRISHGVLNFNIITDGLPEDFDDETIADFEVSFICNNKQHEVKCTLANKYFDFNLVYYIVNEIIRKDHPGYQLTEFITSGYQNSLFLFATREQNNYLEKMKLRAAIDRF